MINRMILSLVVGLKVAVAASDLPALPSAENLSNVIDTRPTANLENVMAYLGVGSKEVPKELLKHIKTPTEKGVLVKMVAPNSPAFEAGINVGDIIYEMNSMAIDCRDCLREMIKDLSPGDKVSLGVMKEGVASELIIALGEAPIFQSLDREDQNVSALSSTSSVLPSLDKLFMDDSLLALIDPDHKKSMEEMKESLLKMDIGSESLFQQLVDQIDSAEPRSVDSSEHRFFSKSSETKTVIAGNLAITVQSTNNDQSLIVKDRKGKLIYEGPYNTKEDKDEIPKHIKKRLKALKL